MTEENFSYKDLIKYQEKIKFLIKKINDLEQNYSNLDTCIKIIENKNIDKLTESLHQLELRIKTIEIAQKDHDYNWKSIINFFIQIIWVIMAAYILLKLGLQPPI